MVDGKLFGATLEEFYKMVEDKEIYGDLIVRLAYKYDYEEKYEVSNEVGCYNHQADCFDWFNDWDEGQQDVYVLGFIKVDNVIVNNIYKEIKL